VQRIRGVTPCDLFAPRAERAFDSRINLNYLDGSVAYEFFSRAVRYPPQTTTSSAQPAKGTGLRDPDCSMKAALCAADYGEWFDFAKNIFRR
jgi:hypothetical protein